MDVNLLKLAQNGDKQVRDKLILDNMGLVYKVANKFKSRCENKCDFDDFIQLGTIGLIKAVDNYDPEKGSSFSYYAYVKIGSEINRYIREKINVINLIPKDNVIFSKIQKEIDNMLIENHRYPSIKELSEKLEIDIQYLGELLNAKLGGWDSLYNNTTEDNNLMLIDIVEDESDDIMKFINDDFILELLSILTDKEKYIIYRRYIYELTQEEVSLELDCNRTLISRMEKRALNKIKNYVKYKKGVKDCYEY